LFKKAIHGKCQESDFGLIILFASVARKNPRARGHETRTTTGVVDESKRRLGVLFPLPSRGGFVPAAGVYTAPAAA
jgi:hypothetical protein